MLKIILNDRECTNYNHKRESSDVTAMHHYDVIDIDMKCNIFLKKEVINVAF